MEKKKPQKTNNILKGKQRVSLTCRQERHIVHSEESICTLLEELFPQPHRMKVLIRARERYKNPLYNISAPCVQLYIHGLY